MSVAACSCGQKFRVSAEMAGKKAKCTNCGKVLVIPGPEPSTAPSTAASGENLVAQCACGVKFRVRPEMAGKQARCPKCKSVLQLPGPAVAASTAASATAAQDFGFGPARNDDDFWSELGPTKADLELEGEAAGKKKKAAHEEFGTHEALAFTVKQASNGRTAKEILKALRRRGVSKGEATRVVESVLGDPDNQKVQGGQDVGWLLFSSEGRCNRGQWWLGTLVNFILTAVTVGVLVAMIFNGVITLQVANMVAAPVELLTLYISVNLLIKRLHDLGFSGRMCFLMAIPIVGLVLVLYAAFAPGQHDSNEYGHPPR